MYLVAKFGLFRRNLENDNERTLDVLLELEGDKYGEDYDEGYLAALRQAELDAYKELVPKIRNAIKGYRIVFDNKTRTFVSLPPKEAKTESPA